MKNQINVVCEDSLINKINEMVEKVGIERCQLIRMLITQAYEKIKEGTFTVGGK